MAKGIDINGTLRGKRGGLVYYRANGDQISRVKVTPSNPKTLAQATQRCAFAMATSASSGLKFLVNHSFQGINTEKENIREFVRVNTALIKAQLQTSIVDGGDALQGNAQIKGARGMQAANYIVSRGSVFFPEFTLASGAAPLFSYPLQGSADAVSATIDTQAKYVAALAALGLEPGDQISAVGIVEFPTVIKSYDTENNYLNSPYGARVTLKNEIPSEFSGTLFVNGVINSELVEESVGSMGFVVSDGTVAISILNVPTGGTFVAGGLIRSQRDISGNYMYSPCQLQFIGEGIAESIVVQSYMQQTTTSDSDYFLDNAELPNA